MKMFAIQNIDNLSLNLDLVCFLENKWFKKHFDYKPLRTDFPDEEILFVTKEEAIRRALAYLRSLSIIIYVKIFLGTINISVIPSFIFVNDLSNNF